MDGLIDFKDMSYLVIALLHEFRHTTQVLDT